MLSAWRYQVAGRWFTRRRRAPAFTPEAVFLGHLLKVLQAAATDTIPLPEARSIATSLVRERMRELVQANNRTAATIARAVRR